MILQALVQYYEDLLANGKITRPGWTSAKVSWALELDENGQLMALHPLQQEEKRGKKTVLAPCQLQVPEQVKRSSGVAAKITCWPRSHWTRLHHSSSLKLLKVPAAP